MDEIEAESENKVQLREDADVIKEKLSDILPRFLDGSELKKELNFELIFRPGMKSAHCNRDRNEIHFGTNNWKLENLKVARKTLVHEAIHAAGVDHCAEMRSLDFYSNFGRDLFTNKIMERLGWQPPSEKEVAEYGRKKGVYVPENRLDYKYVVYCPSCGYTWLHKIRSKSVKHPEKYRCTECDVALKSRELTGAEKKDINADW